MPHKILSNIYKHAIDLTNLSITNAPQREFREELEKIQYKGYQVEELIDGRKVVITKPGGKLTYGQVKREDFMVWVYDPKEQTLWLISHKNILDDLKEKGQVNPEQTIQIINALEEVFQGKEPEEVIKRFHLSNPVGELPELLLKVYKWIWGQEDVNYPDGKGRAMSWEGWTKKDGQWLKTGDGVVDLRSSLKDKLSGP